MSITIPRSLVEYVLLGPTGDRRQLQDSPIPGDVWIAFAKEPEKPQELLITPHQVQTAGRVALALDDLIEEDRRAHPLSKEQAHIAYLQGIIAARLYFEEVLRVVVPMTEWWKSSRNSKDMGVYLSEKQGAQRLNQVLDVVQHMVAHWSAPTKNERIEVLLSAFDRYAALAGIILWASKEDMPGNQADSMSPGETAEMIKKETLAEMIKNGKRAITKGLTEIFNDILKQFPPKRQKNGEALIYQISLNREVTMAVSRSVPAVKADAARTLFKVNCSKIAWVVIDSGIQGDHASFKGSDGESRVKASFDFSNFRQIVSLDNLRIFNEDADKNIQAERLAKLLHKDLKNKPSKDTAIELLTNLAKDVRLRRPIHWEFVEPFIEIKPNTRPTASDHGTHVAGIIGADMQGAKKLPKDQRDEYMDGVCPDIQLYDFRVLADTIKDTEFAVIAALQYIRHMNERNDFITIHGANLSLSIPHDVRNYACGHTPVCVECERLVDSGVVVVAAAGNFGYQSFETKEGPYESYTAFSVTDPGNADGVITVGATHRYSPHTYGVSFFSSRGPTGDGRLKPDLVAPGERIRAPFREGWGDLDGTSMAAPHVSGAAAMLMARYSELIGQPRRIKRILCESATDLGRERSFQGYGMLDVLRAFQSI
jgi:serine protease AprX